MSWEVRQGDALERLREMPDESVQTVVTSPPYFGLRDYGTAEWEGGDCAHCGHPVEDHFSKVGNCSHPGCDCERPVGCDHVRRAPTQNLAASLTSVRGGAETKVDCRAGEVYGDTCGKCGARRIDSQLGLEPTPEQYVANLVAVFREVRRVLRKDGTAWLNLGDSYYASTATQGRNENRSAHAFADGSHGVDGRSPALDEQTSTSFRREVAGLKPKDLCGIPWSVAFALRADGWWLRSDIIWSKPNPMPESVTDRPTRAHEYLFLLTKSARYFYDADAIREPHDFPNQTRTSPGLALREATQPGNTLQVRPDHEPTNHPAGRNRRSVWEIATAPYPEAHFATFPPKLVEPCILAGSAKGDTVCDPFAGSGTTGVVALRHDRSFIGIELNESYCELARNRIREDAPLLNAPLEVAA